VRTQNNYTKSFTQRTPILLKRKLVPLPSVMDVKTKHTVEEQAGSPPPSSSHLTNPSPSRSSPSFNPPSALPPPDSPPTPKESKSPLYNSPSPNVPPKSSRQSDHRSSNPSRQSDHRSSNPSRQSGHRSSNSSRQSGHRPSNPSRQSNHYPPKSHQSNRYPPSSSQQSDRYPSSFTPGPQQSTSFNPKFSRQSYNDSSFSRSGSHCECKDNCQGQVEVGLCKACFQEMSTELRDVKSRAGSLITGQLERDTRMSEMSERMKESLEEVQRMGEEVKGEAKLKEELEKRDRKIEELEGFLKTKDVRIKELEFELELKRELLGPTVKFLQEALCKTVREEIRTASGQPDIQTIRSNFFFESGPQTVWADREKEVQEKEGQEKEGQEKEGQEKEGQEKEGQEKEDQEKEDQEKEDQEKEDQEKEGESDLSNSGLEEKEEETTPQFSLKRYKDKKSIIILIGDTESYEDELAEMNGKKNDKAGGWLFSLKKKEALKSFISAKTGGKKGEDKRREDRKANKASKLRFNEEMGVLTDRAYEFLFHPDSKEAFAHMDDSENIHPLEKTHVRALEKRDYSVMDKRERAKYLDEYLEKNAPLTEKLIDHPKLAEYMTLENYPYLFTGYKVAFCKLEGDECTPISRDDIEWLKDKGFDVLAKRTRNTEMQKVEEFLEELGDSDIDIDSDSDSDRDSDSD